MSTVQVNNISVSIEVISTVITTNYPTASPTPSPTTVPAPSPSNNQIKVLNEAGVISISVILGIFGIGIIVGLIIKYLCGSKNKVHTDISVNTQNKPNGKIHPEYKITEIRTGEQTRVL